jgi:hypothetical protein
MRQTFWRRNGRPIRLGVSGGMPVEDDVGIAGVGTVDLLRKPFQDACEHGMDMVSTLWHRLQSPTYLFPRVPPT